MSEQIHAVPDEQFWFENFRMGIWPDLYKDSRFPEGEAALNQFFRQITPNTGAYDEQVITRSLVALCDTLEGCILITHSQGGGPGWHTAINSAACRPAVGMAEGKRAVDVAGHEIDV